MTQTFRSRPATIKLYTTPPHPCSYLPGCEAVTVFADPFYPMNAAAYSHLSAVGFRRSGGHVYRPACRDCQACIPARIPAADFRPDRSQRRTWRRNADLTVRTIAGVDPDRHYALYARYLEARHRDGDMYPPARDQFTSFLSCDWADTTSYEFSLEGRPVAVAVVDRMPDALSAIYTFFEPELPKRALGVYAVLWQVEQARRLGLSWVYLGYWIKECPKMSYKGGYRPLEVLVRDRWVRLS